MPPEEKAALRARIIQVAEHSASMGLRASDWLEQTKKRPWFNILSDREVDAIIYTIWRVELVWKR